MTTWYRLQHADSDPAGLLDPSAWQSSAWEPIYKPCPCCDGYDHGDVEDVRHGVSACASLDDLIAYFGSRDCDYGPEYIDRLRVVEVEGGCSDDDDHDADYGAYLVEPTRIVAVHPVPDGLRAVIQHVEAA